jgi:peptide/nickel transport system substrate-binding protein
MRKFLLALLTLILPPMPAAFPASLSFQLDAPWNRGEEAKLISEQLANAGIHAVVKLHDPSELRELARKGQGRAYLTDWGSSFFDPFDLVVPKLTTGGRENFSFYSNPRVDDLLTRGASSADAVERERVYRDVQEILYHQTPWVFGYVAPRFEAVAAAVQGYLPALDSRINLHNVHLAEGDTLAVALDTDAFLSLDPGAYRGRETETMIRNLFDGLVTRTPDGRVVLELAESFRQVDPTTYVFTLRRGPLFHNGEPVTVEDVVFTFQRILNPYGIHGSPSPRRDLLGPLERVEAEGPNEVRFVLERSFPLFLQALVHF